MTSRRKAAHVGTNLGEEDLDRGLAQARNLLQSCNGVTKGLKRGSGIDGERRIGSDESQLTKFPPEVVGNLRFERRVVLLDALGLARTRDNVEPSIHMRCRITASLRATATLARFMPRRLATSSPQRFTAEKRVTRDSKTFAAS